MTEQMPNQPILPKGKNVVDQKCLLQRKSDLDNLKSKLEMNRLHESLEGFESKTVYFDSGKSQENPADAALVADMQDDKPTVMIGSVDAQHFQTWRKPGATQIQNAKLILNNYYNFED
jgi:hypothetical protein